MKKAALLLAVLGMLLAGTVRAQSGAELLSAKGCLGCHDMNAAKVAASEAELTAAVKHVLATK